MIEPTAAISAFSNSEALFQTAAHKVASSFAAPSGPPPSANGDTADLSSAAVSLIQSRNNFQAVTQQVRIGMEIDKALVDVAG